MKAKMILTVAVLMLILSGCGNDAKVIQGEVQTKDAGGSAKTDGGTETEGKSGDSEANVKEAAPEYKGYAFLYQNTVIEMDADAAPIVEKLGEADFYFEAPSCAFEGIDKMYTYSGFELDTYPTKDKDYVSSVVFKDDTVTTAEGIGIGDSKEKLEEIYGTQWTDENGMMVYEKDGMKLCFILQEDQVISVEYRSTVMDE